MRSKMFLIVTAIFTVIHLFFATFGIVHSGSENPDVVNTIAWSPDGTQIAYGTHDGNIWIINMTNNATKKIVDGYSVNTLAWNKDGLLASGDDNSSVYLWNTATGKMIKAFPGHETRVVSVSWGPDGIQLASGSDSGTGYNVYIWNIITGKSVQHFNVGDMYALAWSPTGNKLVIDRDEKLEVWDIVTATQIWYTKTFGFGPFVAWSPDGKQIADVEAYTGPDAAIRIWDAQTGALMKELKGHADVVNSIAWSPDGKKLLSASSDHTVKVWDTVTSQIIATYSGTDFILSAVWSPYGGRIAYADVVQTKSIDSSNGISSTDSTIKIVVPPLKTSDVKNIIERCISDINIQKQLISDIDQLSTSRFKTETQNMSNKIPSGCLADITSAIGNLTDKEK